MLSLRAITLTDFGPFKGEQRMEFPPESGVSIVYGENMRGKTTLLNAIRYALFGKVIARGENRAMLHQIGNWETAAEKSKYGFKVVLEFEHEGSKYQLTREHRLRSGVTKPESDIDYQQDCWLSKDGSVLGPELRDTELARIMPETVSRFFLFDGELLQQYEELLRNESDMGRNIKEAIERILGVPVLTNCRTVMGELLTDAQRREAKAAQKNQKTQSLGNQHEALLKQRDGQQSEVERLKQELDTLRASKTSKEEMLRKTEKTKGLLDERSRVKDEISSAEIKLKEREDRFKELLSVAWKGLLSTRIRVTRDGLEQQLRAHRDSYQRSIVSSDVHDKLRKALEDGQCSTCEQALSDPSKARIKALIDAALPKEGFAQIETEIQHLEHRIAALRQSEASSNADVLAEVQRAIDDLRIAKATAEDRLQDLKDQTKDLDEADIRRLYSEYDKTVTEIGILLNGIKNSEDAVKISNDTINKVEVEMAKFADADLEVERKRRELCDNLKALFSSAVDAYRDRLRGRVEKDATELFIELTSEPEYKGLKI